MVARPGSYQASNNSGELAPELHARTDIKQYYGGLALARNVEPVPQGGSRLSPRTRHRGLVRHHLAWLTPSSTTIETGPVSTAAVIASITFAQPQPVSVVSFAGMRANVALSGLLLAEWFDGDNWHFFAPAISVDARARTRAVGRAPGESVQAISIRLRLAAAPPSPVTFTIAGMSAARETAALPTARVRPFTFSQTQTYVAVIGPGVIDFWRDGAWVGLGVTNIADALIGTLDVQQRFDTMLLFHDDLRSLRLTRNASDHDWPCDPIPYEGTPQVDLGGAYDNAVVDRWNVYLRYPSSDSPHAGGANVLVVFNVDGEETEAVNTGAPDWGDFEAAIKDAIEALPSLSAGVTITVTGAGSLVTIVIEFTGAGNEGAHLLTARVVNTGEAAATAAHTSIGRPGGELLMSAQRGWPACATFYQDRLIKGGFKARPGAVLASVTGEYYDDNIEVAAASGAILVNLDTDGAEKLHHLTRAKHLIMFTTDAEYFVSDRELNRQATPNIVNSSRNGSATGVPVVESEGDLIYVSRNRSMIYGSSYDDVSQAYVSEPLSLLASHMVNGIVDAALQRAAIGTDAARHWLVREGGDMVPGIMIRNQEIVAYVRWETAGAVRSVCVDGANIPHVLAERTVNGAPELFLESLEQGLVFDATVDFVFDPPSDQVSGLTMHAGAQVWAMADGFAVGPLTVSASGLVTLPLAASVVSVGRWTPPRAITLPIPSDVAERVVVQRPKRVHTVRLDVMDTTSLAIGANGQPAREVALYRAGDPTDIAQSPYTGIVTVPGLTGFSDTGEVEITQARPGHLQWRSITVEART